MNGPWKWEFNTPAAAAAAAAASSSSSTEKIAGEATASYHHDTLSVEVELAAQKVNSNTGPCPFNRALVRSLTC